MVRERVDSMRAIYVEKSGRTMFDMMCACVSCRCWKPAGLEDLWILLSSQCSTTKFKTVNSTFCTLHTRERKVIYEVWCVYLGWQVSLTLHLRTAALQREGGGTCSIHDSGSIHSKVEKYL